LIRLLLEQPKRMAFERRLLLEHASSTPSFTIQLWGKTGAGELCLNFQLKLLVGSFDGVLVYPNLFPDVPAYIRPQAPGQQWSSHQYLGSGVLCLQYGPDNWHPGITGVDLVRSANLLLWGELMAAVQPTFGPVASRHNLTTGQGMRGEERRFLATAGLRSALTDVSLMAVELKTVVTYLAGSSVVVATSLGAPPAPVKDLPLAFAEERFEWSGWAVPVPSIQVLRSADDAVSLKAVLGTSWPWAKELDDQLHVLLLHDATGGMLVLGLTGGTDPLLLKYHVVDFNTDAEQRLPAEFSKLSGLDVAIVGLGSLGSKIAVSLARAGIRRFLLVDDDVLAPHNLVRNELNWLDVGFSKVDAVGRELKRIAPGIEVRTRRVRIAGQENPQLAASLCADLTKSALLIDATASPHAFVALAASARRSDIPMVWGEVFGGGAGALMARSRPHVDADPLSVRTHILGVMSTMTKVPDTKVRHYGVEADGQVYIASDADVSALAAFITQFSLDTLCSDEESVYPVAAYLIGFRKYWEFKAPFDTIPIDCSGALQPDAPPEVLTADEVIDLAELTKAVEGGVSAADNCAH
jgi:hypothetical protein